MSGLKRVLLTTGGTGGHIFPALAVAQAVRERNPGCEMLFVGGRGPEKGLAEKAGLEFASLPVRGVLGRGFKGLLAMLGLGLSVFRALSLLRRFRPQAVAGFGGFAGFCPVVAAWLTRTPTLIHEQNSTPGLANRILGRLARRVCVSFEQSAEHFPARKVLRTGNPVRADIVRSSERRWNRNDSRRLLVLGGSQGARAINDAVVDALPALTDMGVEILHQAGTADEDRVRAAYRQAGADPSRVRGFMDDMAEAYAWADLALCRAGASTVFELAAAGLPAVFVPFPFATHDHQTTNARSMVAAKAARLVPQDQLTPEGLVALAEELFTDRKTLRAMALASLEQAMPQAAETIAKELETLGVNS